MTAEQRAGLSDAALAMTQPCIDELIKDISRRVQKAGAITDTAEYQLYRAQALGESKKAIEQAVSKQIGISEEVIASPANCCVTCGPIRRRARRSRCRQPTPAQWILLSGRLPQVHWT